MALVTLLGRRHGGKVRNAESFFSDVAQHQTGHLLWMLPTNLLRAYILVCCILQQAVQKGNLFQLTRPTARMRHSASRSSGDRQRTNINQ